MVIIFIIEKKWKKLHLNLDSITFLLLTLKYLTHHGAAQLEKEPMLRSDQQNQNIDEQ